jgi:hypothetical protein
MLYSTHQSACGLAVKVGQRHDELHSLTLVHRHSLYALAWAQLHGRGWCLHGQCLAGGAAPLCSDAAHSLAQGKHIVNPN